MEEFLTDLEKQLELKVEEKTLNIENMFGKVSSAHFRN